MKDWSNQRPSSAGSKPAIDDTVPVRLARFAAQEGCDRLLKAQLRFGQHILPIANARAIGATLGMLPHTVRAAPGDPTAKRAA